MMKHGGAGGRGGGSKNEVKGKEVKIYVQVGAPRLLEPGALCRAPYKIVNRLLQIEPKT